MQNQPLVTAPQDGAIVFLSDSETECLGTWYIFSSGQVFGWAKAEFGWRYLEDAPEALGFVPTAWRSTKNYKPWADQKAPDQAATLDAMKPQQSVAA